ncbi:hypothetical protein BB347_17725 (plasmid) [Natronorubrum daqingense]|nr:hypothetical protein BB347_17725 [Natronorubrum daqingense]
MVFAMITAGSLAMAGGAAAEVTDDGDFEFDGDDLAEDFEAGDDNETVVYETDADSDSVEDFDDITLEIDYENTTLVEYDHTDADVDGDDDEETPLELEFTVEHEDLETLPGDAGEETEVDATVTEAEIGEDEVTDEDTLTYEFADSHAAMTIFDADDDDDIVSLEEDDDDGMFSFSMPFTASDLDNTADIDDDIGVNGTETDVHVHSDDSDVTDTFDDSVEDKDEGDRVPHLMTTTVDDRSIVVFNEEPGEFIGGDEADEDEDTYAVYNGDGHLEINLGEDRFDEDDDEVSVNSVSGVEVTNDLLTNDLDYGSFEAWGLTADSFTGTLSDGWASLTDTLPF